MSSAEAIPGSATLNEVSRPGSLSLFKPQRSRSGNCDVAEQVAEPGPTMKTSFTRRPVGRSSTSLSACPKGQPEMTGPSQAMQSQPTLFLEGLLPFNVPPLSGHPQTQDIPKKLVYRVVTQSTGPSDKGLGRFMTELSSDPCL